jgi:hypothetical protein
VIGLAFAIGTGVTWAGAFFWLPVVLHAFWTRRFRWGAAVGFAGGLGIAAAVLVHGLCAPAGVAGAGLLERAELLLEPLLSGARPLREWLGLQWHYASEALGLPILLLGCVGCIALLVRKLHSGFRARWRALEVDSPAEVIEVGALLLAGTGLYFLAFYRHTLEAQRPFQLLLAPAVAALAASALAPLARPLLRLRAGIAPHVLVVASALLPGLWNLTELERDLRARGPADDPPSTRGPALALPARLAAELAPLLPRGSLAFVPAALGTNPALAFYAWRNILPVVGAPDAVPYPFASSRWLAEAPRYLCLPEIVPQSAGEAVTALRDELVRRGIQAESNAHWSRFALP